MFARLHSLLYGALRRAVEWHHASVTVVHSVKVDRYECYCWHSYLFLIDTLVSCLFFVFYLIKIGKFDHSSNYSKNGKSYTW